MNVKMPTIVGILTFMSRKIKCSAELSMKCFNNLGDSCSVYPIKVCFWHGTLNQNIFVDESGVPSVNVLTLNQPF